MLELDRGGFTAWFTGHAASPGRTPMRRLAFTVLSKVMRVAFAVSTALNGSLLVAKYRLALWLAYEPRRDDIFIVTYPKAGTTVLQMMLYQMTTDGDMGISHIDAVAPWFELLLVRDPGHLNALPSPRVFKTHLTFAQLPRIGRFIYAVRNPKDSCVSYYHHLVSLHGSRLSFSEFVRCFVAGKVSWGSWFKHFRVCFPHRLREDVLFITYDELRQDLPKAVERVGAFCGLEIGEAQRRRTLERCGLAFMKAHNEKFDPRLATPWTRTGQDFIRTGMVGEWAGEMASEDSAAIDRRLQREIERLSEPLSADERRALLLR